MTTKKTKPLGGELLRTLPTKESLQKDRLPPRNAIVTRSNRLIEASHDLNLRQMKLINLVVRAIQDDDEDYKYYDIDVPLVLEYLELTGSGSARDEIRTVTRNLLQRVIDIQINEEEWEQFAWLSYSRVLRRGNRLVLRVSITPEMRPYIRDLKQAFTKTPFYQITAFRSRYGWRFYEWCKQFEDTGWLIINVSDLRSRLQIQEHEYQRFNNLRQRVINPAVTEINKVSDLTVTLAKLEKKGRYVDTLKFKIERKEVHVIPVEDSASDERSLIIARLQRHGMPQREAERNVDRFYEIEREHLLGCLADLEHRIETGFAFQDNNPLIWLRYILKNDPREQPSLFTRAYSEAANRQPSKEEVEARERRTAARERIAYLERIQEQANRSFDEHRRQRLAEYFTPLPEAERTGYQEQLLAAVPNVMHQFARRSNFWEHRAFSGPLEALLAGTEYTPTDRASWLSEQGIDEASMTAELEQLQALADA